MLAGARKVLAAWLTRGLDSPAVRKVLVHRSYHAGKRDRLTAGWAPMTSTADAELAQGLATMRDRSRDLIRNSSYAKRAKAIVVNNVVGPGIGLQAKVVNRDGKLLEKINEDIEAAWEEWTRAENCHAGGVLDFGDLERLAMGEIFEAGEHLNRRWYSRFGRSRIPFALEVIESERLADYAGIAPAGLAGEYRLGLEVDRFGRPMSFLLRQRPPGDILGVSVADAVERVPADLIDHLYIVNRWPQTRGEPWLHTAIRRLNDMDGYGEAEIVAARGAANYMAFIIRRDADPVAVADAQDGNEKHIQLDPGLVEELPPGAEVVMNNPNRPNPNMDAFMRLMLREVAAGVGVSYESLSRDYSQSNYSSSRLALLDDRDLWRVLQAWFIRKWRLPLHRVWLQQAILSGAIPSISPDEYLANPKKFEAVRFKPRGWGWVDPTKEVDAYIAAVRAGFTTVGDVIAASGNGADIEDTLEARKAELDMMADAGLVFDTDPAKVAQSGQAGQAPADAATQDNVKPLKVAK